MSQFGLRNWFVYSSSNFFGKNVPVCTIRLSILSRGGKKFPRICDQTENSLECISEGGKFDCSKGPNPFAKNSAEVARQSAVKDTLGRLFAGHNTGFQANAWQPE